MNLIELNYLMTCFVFQVSDDNWWWCVDQPSEGRKPWAGTGPRSAHSLQWSQSDPSGQKELLHHQVAKHVIHIRNMDKLGVC